MKLPALLGLLLLTLACNSHGQSSPEAKPLVTKIIAAAGGEDKLLRLFRMKEQYHSGADPLPPGGKPGTRESVLDAPGYWWIGKKDRTGEPAKFDVWAWTLVAFTDAKTKVDVIPDLTDGEQTLFGLRLSYTINPAMDLYFDKELNRLVRLDWRGDIYRFSEWKEHDGAKYAAKTVLYKKSTGKPWFYHEITSLERLKELPAGLTREVAVTEPKK